MKQSLLNFRVFTLALVLLLAATAVNAQSRVAVADGNWNNIATWGGASIPGSGDDVTINNGVMVQMTANATCKSITIGATDDITGITINGSNSLTVLNGVTIGNLLDNTSGVWIDVAAGTFSCASLTMADVTSSNDDITLSISTGKATITGNLTMNGQGGENLVTISGSGQLNIGDISTTNGTFSVTNSSTVNYTGATQTIRPATYGNLILSGSGAKTIAGATINASLSIQGSATLTGASPAYGAGSTLEYAGNVAQTTSDVEFPSASAPQTLIVNNSNGVTLHATRTLASELTLTSGVLHTTSTNILRLADNAVATGASDNSFVSGPVTKVGNDAFTFPLGSVGSGLHTIGISAPGSPLATFTADFFRGDAHAQATSYGTGLTQVSGCEYWTLARTGTSNVRVILSWASGSACNGAGYVGNLSTLRIARLSAGSWTSEGSLSTTGSTTAGTITSALAVSNFGTTFVLATSAPDNALPVMFADVKAFEKNIGVQLEWSNLTERDLVNYVVERSADGRTFTSINQQLPRSNQNDKESYSAFDATPFSGVNYYRIKALEISGKMIYSKLMKVEIGSKPGFSLYPNPVVGNQVTVSISSKQGQYSLKVLNSAGQEVYAKRLSHQGGAMTQNIDLPTTVKPGVYNMVVTGDNYREAKTFIVQ
jgi:hypothetical protein